MSDEQDRPSVPLASRYGLVRPLQGRYVAGVCAGLGRATRTDPVLWRVVLAVLVCFAGIGAVLYLALWVLTPEEGDTASPVEAVLGRGHSNTSPALAVILSVVAAGLLILILPRPLYLVLLGGALVLTVLLLTNRAGAAASTGTAPPGTAPPGTAPPGTAPPAGAGDTHGAPVDESAPPAPASPPAAAAVPRGTGAAVPPAGAPYATGYQAPFAPHGPFAGPPPPPPPAPPPARARSPLPGITFFTTLLVLGALGALDLSGALAVPAAGYVTAALAVVGAGLVAGAWLGRARALIAFGVVLALALPITHALGAVQPPEHMGDVSWAPQSRADLADDYSVRFGSGRLDLRQINLAGEDVQITVDVMFGDVWILVPDDVPVEATVNTRFASATVFDTTTAGLTQEEVTDPGSGDPEQGVLRLELRARFADMEVRR